MRLLKKLIMRLLKKRLNLSFKNPYLKKGWFHDSTLLFQMRLYMEFVFLTKNKRNPLSQGLKLLKNVIKINIKQTKQKILMKL